MNARRAWWVRYVARVAGPTFAAADREDWGRMLLGSVGVDTPAVRRKLERELRRNARPGAAPRGRVSRDLRRNELAGGFVVLDEPAPDAAWRERVARASTPPVVAHTPKRGRAAWLAAAMLAALAAGGGR